MAANEQSSTNNQEVKDGGEPLRDKNGLTEAEFLAQYTPKKYPQPSLTADICVFRKKGNPLAGTDGLADSGADQSADPASDSDGLQLLLVQRGGHPFLGCWATPGGFCNPNETADACAERELAEETGVTGLKLEPVALFSTPGRDPRGWTISYAFVALDDQGSIAKAGDDAAKAVWFDVSTAASTATGRTTLTLTHGDTRLTSTFTSVETPITGRLRAADVVGSGLAFDHAQIVADAWLTLVGA